MKQLTLPSGEYLLVEVPEDANKFFMGATCHTCNQMGCFNCAHPEECGQPVPAIKIRKDDVFLQSTELPPGTWSLIGRCSELSEEDWKWIVDAPEKGSGGLTWWNNYSASPKKFPVAITATESGHSLLAQEGMSTNSLLLKLQK